MEGFEASASLNKYLIDVPCLLILATVFITVTIAFDDLREADCRASWIDLQHVSDENVEWYGGISLELVCDEGFDFPINFNPESSTNFITCKGNNRWEPDFLPNCNEEIFPKSGNKCPSGSVAVDTTKGKRCRGCPLGQFLKLEGGRHQCNPCAKGYYQDTAMSADCKKCTFMEEEISEKIRGKATLASKDRQFHPLSCPVVRTLPNGTQVVHSTQNHFADEMRDVLRTRSFEHVQAPKTGSALSTALKRHELMAFIFVVVIVMMAVI